MFQNRKKLFASLLILVSIGIIGWFVLFEYSVRWLEKELEVSITDLKQKGYMVSYSKVEFKGNPFFINVIFHDFQFKDPSSFVEWQGQEVNVSIKPWNFYTLSYSLPGDQTVTISQNTSPQLGVLKVEGAQGVVKITTQGKLENASLFVDRVFSLINAQTQPLSLQALSLVTTNLTDPLNLSLAFKTELIGLETLLKIPPLNSPLTLTLEAHFSGYEPKETFPKTVAEWRDGGGVLEVSHLKVIWPPILAEAEGTLTFDKEMYPLGSFSSRIVGYQNILNYMVELGWMKKKNASTASFMLDLFSASDETGEKRLTVPITLQNKRLSIGPAPLIKLRPLAL
jgi:hypothetical protein